MSDYVAWQKNEVIALDWQEKLSLVFARERHYSVFKKDFKKIKKAVDADEDKRFKDVFYSAAVYLAAQKVLDERKAFKEAI